MAVLTAPVYNIEGLKIGDHELSPGVFAVAIKDAVIQQAVVAQLANARQAIAHTKGRGEVRGGGKKPWRQKGTGRARHGSIRSPLWRKGGITFGPTKERNFTVKVNKKMRREALRMILSDKVKHERFLVLDSFPANDVKTKQLASLLAKLPSKNRKTAIVTQGNDTQVILASRNLSRVQSIGVNSLNVRDLLYNEYVVAPKKVLAIIEERYARR